VHRFTFSAPIADGTPTVDPGATGAITKKHSSAIAGVANSSSAIVNKRIIVHPSLGRHLLHFTTPSDHGLSSPLAARRVQ
jgi:hypothetical protein